MRRFAVTMLALAGLSAAASAQGVSKLPPNYGCPGAEYQQFKFWIGKWDVFATTGGEPAGQSRIESLAVDFIYTWR